jgi:hypothetical protein
VAEALIMRGVRSTVALVVILAGLAAYIYFVTWKLPPDSGPQRDKVFAALQSDQIEELQVKAESGEVTTLKKDAGTWALVAPIATAASDSDVSTVTSALASLEIERVVDENPADVKDFGLDAPRIELDFKADGGKTSGRLIIGGRTPAGSNMYARRNDEPRVFLVAEYQNTSLNKSTFDLRDKAVVKIDRNAVDGLEVVPGPTGQALQLTKTGGDWNLIKPLKARADVGVVEALVGRVETAQMKSVVTENASPADLRKFGLDRPATTVAFHLGSAQATLAFGGPAGPDAVYARDTSKPVVVTVDSALADDARKSADDYRRKDVFEFRAFNATRVELTRNNQTTTFERVASTSGDTPDSWRRTAPSAADADRSKVESLLAGLADVRATSFISSTARTGLDAPALTVFVAFEEGKKEERVAFGKSGADAYALVPGQPGAAKIEAEKLDEALTALDELSK